MTVAYDRPPLVLVDMDGVLADLEAAFWGRWSTEHPTSPQRTDGDPTQFYIEDQLPELYQPQVRDIVNTPGFFATLPPIAGGAQAMRAMLELGWDVRVCTAPLLSNPTCASDKLAWLDEHVGDGWSRRAIVSKDKSLVRGDLLIDDKPVIATSLTPTWQHVVFDATYNQTSPAVHRLHGWARWSQTLNPLTGRTAA